MKLGSLCSGAGALDLAVEAVFGAETVWHCELDPAASAVLAARWPGVPNHGDLINTDWAAVEPVDIICAGWPCQPFSLAGKRKGADDERAIWPHIARAVRLVRPRIIVLENVTAVLAREFGRVADSLATLRYDLRWTCLRASDVGAPHRRERLFIVAADTAREPGGVEHGNDVRARRGTGRHPQATRGSRDTSDTARDGRHEGRAQPAGLVRGSDAPISGDGPVDLLPTPGASDGSGGRSPAQSGGVRPSGAKRSIPLTDLPLLLPTPNAADGSRGQDLARAARDGSGGDDLVTLAVKATNANQWGKYAPAIARWESITRPAPSPTEPNSRGNPRLNPAFSEWMMGWPAGWVTQVDGISRDDQLRIIGNGVVPQQATAALQWLLSLDACGVVA